MNAIFAKQLNLVDFALTSLWRRRLKNGALLLVFAAVIFLLASFHLVATALGDRAGQVLERAPDIVIQKMVAGRQESIPLEYSRRLEGLFGIRQITPRIWGYYFDEIRQANFTVLGVDSAQMPLGEHLGQTLAIGEFPVNGPGAVLGGLVAATLELAPGDFFSLFRPDLTLKTLPVSGIFRDETDLLTADLIALNLAEARDLFQLPPELVTDLCVYVYNPAEIENLARRIAQRLPDTRVLTRAQIQRTYQGVFGWRSGMASVCLLAALAAFAILAWDKASGLSPEERREVAILKIIGWETSDILTLRCWEALLVAGGAFLLGIFLAYLHVLYFQAALFRPVLVGWSVIHPALTLVPTIAAQDLLLLFAVTVLPYLVATVIPTWRGAAVPAEDALNG
ncbi:ABC transporter permease [Desulfurivibrio sp. D14AmB]|uniref:ABC transporter permease n=1 Tax=Desulfurivibrio sp. D14AmB TaxID=3374370 RepID=UPI00376EDBBD